MNSGLQFKPIKDNPNLVSESVFNFSKTFNEEDKPLVAEIDSSYMGGKELCKHYGIDVDIGANCVIVEAVKGDISNFVAIVIPVGNRADLNNFVKKYLNVKRVSLAPLEKVLEKTKMEYGSITPFGLPISWKILVDSSVMNKEKIIVGSGKQISKLLLKTKILEQIPSVQIVNNLSKNID